MGVKALITGTRILSIGWSDFPISTGQTLVDLGDIEIPRDIENYSVKNGLLVKNSGPTISQQIDNLEKSITPRMLQEAIIDSQNKGLGSDKQMTAKQFIKSVRDQIDALRTQLV